MSTHEYLCNAQSAVPTPSTAAPRRSPGGGCSGTSARSADTCSGSRTGRTTKPGLDLTPTLRVHPVALNVARLVNKEGTIRLDVFNEEDEGDLQIVVYTAAGQRIVRVTPAGTIAVRDRNGSTVL